jgi:7-dehydrocholesterol reductase
MSVTEAPAAGFAHTYKSERKGPKWLRQTALPAFLIAVCPPTALLVWYTHTALGGSLAALLGLFARDGLFATLGHIWGPVFFGTRTAWAILAVYAATELLLMRALPGKRFLGPVTANGNVPVYKANGVLAYAVTLALFAGGSWGLHLFSPSVVYDNMGGLLGALDVFSLGFCAMLYLKGRFAPSSSDGGSSGNPVFDYYWGTELYPRIAGWDVKMFTNCRFGMMGWPLILISFAAKQHALHGLSDSMAVAVLLQLVYITKFFWWETGYLRSLDIMHDRAGFYICWGCLVWVPAIYTSSTLYLVNHPHHLGLPLSLAIAAAGTASILVNYAADAQRQRVRATGGQTRVWGKPPVVLIGHYVTEKGEAKESLLLASGFWGIARHFHYVPEILGAFFWTLPALFGDALPWFYVVFLTALLTDRAFRDDNRCAIKYGDDWKRYCAVVRYKILPGVV